MPRCKPGQLAWISGGYPENVGVVVEVLHQEQGAYDNAVWWNVVVTRNVVGTVAGGRTGFFTGRKGYILDTDLTPINDPGVNTSVDETIDKPIKEIA